jgi:hypothetical protein
LSANTDVKLYLTTLLCLKTKAVHYIGLAVSVDVRGLHELLHLLDPHRPAQKEGMDLAI